jgi:hypothetical protein
LKIVYLLMRWLLGLAVLVSRGDRAKDAELLVLRHENAALRRNAGRVRYDPVGLDYWIWPDQACGLGSSLSDLLESLPARAQSARLPDDDGPA